MCFSIWTSPPVEEVPGQSSELPPAARNRMQDTACPTEINIWLKEVNSIWLLLQPNSPLFFLLTSINTHVRQSCFNVQREDKKIHWRPQTILNPRHLSGSLVFWVFFIFWGCVDLVLRDFCFTFIMQRSESLLDVALGLPKAAWPVPPAQFTLWAQKTRKYMRWRKSCKHAAFFQTKYNFKNKNIATPKGLCHKLKLPDLSKTWHSSNIE